MIVWIHKAPGKTLDNFDPGQSKYWYRFGGKNTRLGVKANCVTLSKLLNISGPRVPRKNTALPPQLQGLFAG